MVTSKISKRLRDKLTLATAKPITKLSKQTQLYLQRKSRQDDNENICITVVNKIYK